MRCIACGKVISMSVNGGLCNTCARRFRKRREEDRCTTPQEKAFYRGGYKPRGTCIVCGKPLTGHQLTACSKHASLWKRIYQALNHEKIKEQHKERNRRRREQTECQRGRKAWKAAQKHFEECIHQASVRGMEYGEYMAMKNGVGRW